jgi:hypothetical protein
MKPIKDMTGEQVKKLEVKMSKILKQGMTVNYHSIIGGPVTTGPHTCTCDPFLFGGHTWCIRTDADGFGKFICCAAASIVKESNNA